MSPHAVNSFVSDLVQMAQAMERVPELESQVRNAYQQIEELTSVIASREADLEQARSRNGELEQKLHDAEVARDDAEMRFLELDEGNTKVVKLLGQIQGLAVQAELIVNPPKAQPEPEQAKPVEVKPEPVAEFGRTTGHMEGDTVVSNWPQGQSAASPTVQDKLVETGAPVHLTGAETTDNASPQSTTTTSDQPGTDKPAGPFANKRYIDHPFYVNREQWLAGGGTEADYDYREPPKSGSVGW